MQVWLESGVNILLKFAWTKVQNQTMNSSMQLHISLCAFSWHIIAIWCNPLAEPEKASFASRARIPMEAEHHRFGPGNREASLL